MSEPMQMYIRIDASALEAGMARLSELLPHIPERLAEQFIGDLLRLNASGSLLEIADDVVLTAGGAFCRVFRLRLVGLDELVAAAFRAANPDGSLNGRHKESPGVEAVGVGASDSTFGGASSVGPEKCRIRVGPGDV